MGRVCGHPLGLPEAFLAIGSGPAPDKRIRGGHFGGGRFAGRSFSGGGPFTQATEASASGISGWVMASAATTDEGLPLEDWSEALTSLHAPAAFGAVANGCARLWRFGCAIP